MSSYQPYPYSYPQTQVVVAPVRQSSTVHLVFAWIFAIGTGLYLLPWAIAASRNKTNVVSIALLNLFLGWSVIGWIVTLVMACTGNPAQQITIVTQPGMLYDPSTVYPRYQPTQPMPNYPAPKALPDEQTVAFDRRLYDAGVYDTTGQDPRTTQPEPTRQLPLPNDDDAWRRPQQ